MENKLCRFFISQNINGYYFIDIFNDKFKQTKMVAEENLNGYVQCLHDLGYGG